MMTLRERFTPLEHMVGFSEKWKHICLLLLFLGYFGPYLVGLGQEVGQYMKDSGLEPKISHRQSHIPRLPIYLVL